MGIILYNKHDAINTKIFLKACVVTSGLSIIMHIDPAISAGQKVFSNRMGIG